jgi:hypothetical protein
MRRIKNCQFAENINVLYYFEPFFPHDLGPFINTAPEAAISATKSSSTYLLK